MKKTAFILLAIALGLASCGKKEATQSDQGAVTTSDSVLLSKEQFLAAGLELGRVENRALSGTVHVTGMLDVPPQYLVNITAPLGGFLRSTSMLQGMHITKGQVLAVIENPEYIQLQQDFLDTRSQVQFLDAEYRRQEQLAYENVNSQKTLQKSLADLTSMRARNSGLRAKLKMINIDPDKLQPDFIHSTIELLAPINGYVTQVYSSIGAFVSPTDVMFKIVDPEHVHAELVCFERDIPKIKVGQKVRFTLANESEERGATVFLLGREISEDRTVRIHAHLDREDRGLTPGTYLTAAIQTGSDLRPSLPEDAVLSIDNQQVIFIRMSEEVFRMVEVKTGIRENGFVEVSIPGDVDGGKAEVVLKNAYKLLSKMKNSESEE